MSAVLEQLIAQAKTLPPDELQQFRAWLETQAVPDEENAATAPTTPQIWEEKTLVWGAGATSGQEVLRQKALEVGLLREAKPPIQDFTPWQNRTIAEIKGKSLSETIIEERR